MKILVLHNAYQQRGGEDTVVQAEVSMLERAGHTVKLCIVSNDDIVGPLDKLRAFLDAPYAVDRKSWVARLLRDFSPDVVHIHNFFPRITPSAHEAVTEYGVAVVQTLHNYRLLCANAMFLRDGNICEKCVVGSNLWAVVHRCYRGSLAGSVAIVRMQRRARSSAVWSHSVQRFIALTEFARDKFVEGGLPVSKLVVKPNFADAQPIGTTDRSGSLFVGRLSREKGLAVLLDAWRSFPEQQLTVIGDGPERVQLEKMGVPNVNFLGLRSSAFVRDAMLHASRLIVPSLWYEGFPMTVVEAFSAGLPVLASRIGSLSEIVEEGVNGSLFSPGDVKDLRRALEASFDGGNVEAMGLAARAIFEQKYNAAVNLELLEGIYRDAISELERGDARSS